MGLKAEDKIISVLFKDINAMHNSRTISKVVGISHAGAFKILKKLEKEGIVIPKRIGRAVIYSLDLKNPLVKNKVEFSLISESLNYKRWLEEFKGLKDKVKFLILFGSIIRDAKLARDVDILAVAEEPFIREVYKIIKKKNEIAFKKIHLLVQRESDFEEDFLNKNKVTIQILKEGIVLFGHENLTKFFEKHQR